MLTKGGLMAVSLLAILPVSAGAQSGQLTPEQATAVAKICATTACRTGGYEAVVWIDETHLSSVPEGPSPYVTQDGEILIYPGETFAVQFSIVDGKPAAPKFYKRYAPAMPAKRDDGNRLSDNPEDATLPALHAPDEDVDFASLPVNTLVLSYGQRGKEGMDLTIASTMPRTLKLDATMTLVRKGAYDYRATSTCPIGAKMQNFETWSGPLGPMFLGNFRFLPDGAKHVCE